MDIPMDHSRDRRHLTVSLLIRWGCALLVPDCICVTSHFFLRHACGRLLATYCIPDALSLTLTLTSDLGLPLLGVHDASSVIISQIPPQAKDGRGRRVRERLDHA
jgi:hypothetical protein